jgi:hypothetical protein
MYFMLIDNLHEKVVYTTTNLRQALDKQNRLALYGSMLFSFLQRWFMINRLVIVPFISFVL